MNFGIQDIQEIIYQNVKGAGYKGGIPHGKFAKDTAKRIYDELIMGDSEMGTRDWNLIHGFPNELEPVIKKLQNGLGLRMKRDAGAVEVYRWLLDEKTNEEISAFIKWATDAERIRYVGKYRNSPEAIRIDWPWAFKQKETSEVKIKNEDGSLNV